MPIALTQPEARSSPIARGFGIALLLVILVAVGGASVAVYQSPQPIRLGPILVIGPQSQWVVSRMATPGPSSYLVPRQPFRNATAFLPIGNAVYLVDIGRVSIWKISK